ncbi:YjgB family protein [Brevibacillus sp. SYP-B805]|uniref:YjgB family protein n=1 Tax=Brevibacillus sp. SYP-B805 TaxID=1578199 RepID=UPI0013EA24AD|nr:YjgB family protein [Brevibacillus sp. SYP-B805]NGQ95138.1 YjgB family protein [Brevibacillus sp. SYP-B805]
MRKRSRRFIIIGISLSAALLMGAFWAGSILGSKEKVGSPPQTSPDAQPDAQLPLPSPASSDVSQLLLSIQTSARQGKVSSQFPFAAGTSVFDEVEKQLGQPAQTRYANGLTYAAYPDQRLLFGYNKGMQIVEIRWHDPRVQKLSLSQVKQAWGEPAQVSHYANLIVFTYPVNEKVQLRVGAPEPAAANPDPPLDHIGVLYPQGLRNLMAYGSSEELITIVRDMAKEGRGFGTDFTVEHTGLETVEKDWGKPDAIDFVNGIGYAAYNGRGFVFGFNKGEQLVEIRSYDLRLQELTKSQIEKTLGKPAAIHTLQDQVILVYNATDKYQLKVVFPAPTREVPDPHVDHINVFYPRGTVNFMAG